MLFSQSAHACFIFLNSISRYPPCFIFLGQYYGAFLHVVKNHCHSVQLAGHAVDRAPAFRHPRVISTRRSAVAACIALGPDAELAGVQGHGASAVEPSGERHGHGQTMPSRRSTVSCHPAANPRFRLSTAQRCHAKATVILSDVPLSSFPSMAAYMHPVTAPDHDPSAPSMQVQP